MHQGADIVLWICLVLFCGLILLGIIGGVAAYLGMDKWHVAAEGKLARAEYVPHRTVIHFDDGRMFLMRDASSVLFKPGTAVRVMENANGAHRLEAAD